MMPNSFFTFRRAPFWVLVLFVIVLLLFVVVCVLPASTGHDIHHTDDHMLGVPPILMLIAMVLMAVGSTSSIGAPVKPTALGGLQRSSNLVLFPFLTRSNTYRSSPLRR